MASPITVKIAGIKELEKSLEQFSRATARGVMNRALKKAAAPIEQQARSTVTVDTGQLKKSIRTRAVRDQSAGNSAFSAALKSGASRAEAGAALRSAAIAAGRSEAVVRIAATARHAHLIEFGTVKAPAQPFLGPAFLSGREGAVNSIEASLRTEIDKTAKRIAARAKRKNPK